MLFNSYIFVFVFFPICLLGWYGLRRAGRPSVAKAFLLIMSLWFYGYFNLVYLLIMVGSITVNHLFHIGLSKRPDKRFMMLAVVCNLGVLFYFKYFDFFLSTMNGAFGTSFVLRGILLPLGISFFTFQQISFIVDTYRGEIRNCRFLEYALFVAFFPQLIAGPIVNHGEMMPQFERLGQEEVNWERIAEGFVLFVLGFFKKALLADTFGKGVDYGYENLTALGRADVLLVIVFYALQLYFDFSGYCDMARGLGKMLGIEIPVNFDSPYKAENIVDFWKRWHITLNRFFTKYVYIPLGGNRKGQGRMYVNLLIVFFLSGLWHGAGWNFIVWGMLHGVLYAATRFWQRSIRKENANVRKSRFMTLVSQILLFIYVSVAWVYFRAADIAQANSLLKAACFGKWQKISQDMAACFRLDELWYVIKVLHLDDQPFSRYILMFLILATGLYLAMAGENAAQRAERFKYRAGSAVVIAVLAVWCVLSLSGVSTFLYFNF